MQNPAPAYPLYRWEDGKGLLASLSALFALCGAILFRPVVFFKYLAYAGQADINKRMWRAVLFAFFLGYLKLFFDLLNIYLSQGVLKRFLPLPEQLELSLVSGIVLSSPFLLLRPVFAFILTFALVAVSIKLILGFDKPLVPALLVACYRSAAEIFYCIPVFGVVFAGAWTVALLIIGIKEAYSISTFRSLFTAVVVPFITLLFVFLSMGPALNKVVVLFYPEAQEQVVKINDMNAYLYVRSIVQAAETYKQDLGFYPAHLGALKKYIGTSADEAAARGNITGYVYDYQRRGDSHFVLVARPLKKNYSGRFVLFSDETGKIRIGASDGPVIRDFKSMENIITGVQ